MRLQYRNIFGRKVNIEGGNGVVNVSGNLSGANKKGVIYYSTTDDTYFVFDGRQLVPFGAVYSPPSGLTIISSNFTEHKNVISNLVDGYSLDQLDTYYDFTDVTASADSLTLWFPLEVISDGGIGSGNSQNIARAYVGKFTTPSSTFTFSTKHGVNLDDESFALEFEAGHVYEFNVLNKICKLTDITVSERVVPVG